MSTADDGFISLPPGFDSGTLKLPQRTQRPEKADDIVFVPGTPGAAPAPVVADPDPITVSVPVPARDASAPAPAATTSWRLMLPGGVAVTVQDVVLVGRNPSVSSHFPDAQLVPLDDDTHSVSKTHAAFEVDEQGLWVHDLDSTNGVWVVRGTDVTEAVPGRRIRVDAGSSVELGEVVVTVDRA